MFGRTSHLSKSSRIFRPCSLSFLQLCGPSPRSRRLLTASSQDQQGSPLPQSCLPGDNFVSSETKEFNEAKQLFFAQFGNALVTNTYLKVALTLVSLIALGLLLLNFKTQEVVRNFKPLVIRIDEIGRAEAL